MPSGYLKNGKPIALGRKLSNELKEKISKSVKDFILKNPGKIGFPKNHKGFWTKASHIKASNNRKGKPSHRKGKTPAYSPETYKKMSEAVYRRHKLCQFGFLRGNKNISWNGGNSVQYGSGFTGYLKRKIKERDSYECQLCNTINNLVIHHINYNKQNCRIDNLITLCRSCNTKVNFNRQIWQKLFKHKIIAVSL